MKHQFTNFDLLRHLYQETDYLEYIAIELALKSDAELTQTFARLQTANELLAEIELQPSVSSIENILNYSRSLETETR